jgi:integral membrane protein
LIFDLEENKLPFLPGMQSRVDFLECGNRLLVMNGISLKLLRYVSLAEGISFLVLLYAAIYEKRILGNEEAIQIPGMIHGVLFVLFCFLLLHVWIDRRWSFKKAALAFVLCCHLRRFIWNGS